MTRLMQAADTVSGLRLSQLQPQHHVREQAGERSSRLSRAELTASALAAGWQRCSLMLSIPRFCCHTAQSLARDCSAHCREGKGDDG